MDTSETIILFILLVASLSCTCTNGRGTGTRHGKETIEVKTRIDGIDVSRHQGDINWETVSKFLDDKSFVYIKCTEGATHKDPSYKRNCVEAKKNGCHIGGYHYFRMTSSARSQFANFKSVIDEAGFDLIPMVDVETNDRHPISEVQDSLQVLLDLLEKEYGKKPMIYGTNRSYNILCAPKFNDYPLYLGRYGNNAPVIKGPSHYTIWQYSENGKVPGIKKEVDLCRFHPDRSIDDIML